MDRRHLEYLIAVADHGSFTAGAAALHVTQSALSQAVAQLERELGTPLFQRGAGGAALTATGEAVLEPARRVLRDFADVHVAAGEVAGLARGHLDVAALPTLAHWPAGPLVAAFRRRHPGMSVHIRGPARPVTQELAEMVYRGVCELGLTESGVATGGLLEDHLLSHDYVALLPPEYARWHARTIPLDELFAIGLIVGPWWETSRPYLALRGERPEEVERAVMVRIDYREAYLPLIVAGAGAAVLPRYAADLAAASGAVPAELDTDTERHLSLIRRHTTLSPAAQGLYEVAHELFGAAGPARR